MRSCKWIGNQVRVLTNDIVVGSFDLPMPKSASSRDDIVDTASLVVNVEKQSFEVSEESDTYNVKPKEGGKPYTSLIALNGESW